MNKKGLFITILICIIFFIAYATLSLIKHNHFLSGYDLGVDDQAVWKYSQFKNPITTSHAYYDTSVLSDHVEFIYILLAPFYWIYSSVKTLLVLQVFFICMSGIPIFLLAQKKGLSTLLSAISVCSYLSFYGIQNAIWNDVHSIVFGVSFLAWFLYFLEINRTRFILLFFFLAILCKEDVAYLIVIISFVSFITTRRKINLAIMTIAIVYLSSIFLIYFPHFTRDGYRFSNPHGLLSDINFSYLYDSASKRNVYIYSLGWFGFLPIFAPFYLIPAASDIFHYFVLGHNASGAQGIFSHYQSSLALFLVWPTIIFLAKQKRFKNLLPIYLIFCMLSLQYVMHLPLAYLVKSWFWQEPKSRQDIERVILHLPPNASVVSQNNITPHITHRDEIYTLWPTTKEFTNGSPCNKKTCEWFRWGGNPSYLIVDTSSNWDIRHFLANREDFIEGLHNLEIKKIIKIVYYSNSAALYKVLHNP